MEEKNEKNVETTDYSSNKSILRSIDEVLNRFKIHFILNLLNLILSLVSCVLYIFSTYQPCLFHNSNVYLLFNFGTRCYFLIDVLFNIFIVQKNKLHWEEYFAIALELFTILPYLYFRLFVKFIENYSNFSYILTNSFVTLRVYRIVKLSTYIVSNFYSSGK